MRKIQRLHKALRQHKRVVIAYSGGLDSTFLLKSALSVLGAEQVLAVTAASATYPAAELREARRIARALGARHLIVRTNECTSPAFLANPVDRCYHCKRELFSVLDKMKRRYGMQVVLDGTNRDDLSDIRHGRRAAAEMGVASPLADVGITKADIRRHSRALRLPTWNKPSFACLASRIPFQTAIRTEDLRRIEKAETFVRSLGFDQVRLRFHGDIARLELYPNELRRAVSPSVQRRIVARLKKLGFTYITLDLEGYRTGSMHEAAKRGARERSND